ncbi:MAG: hypothetical protein WCC29_00225, partial [Pseudomonas farsensis]|uniref:hypothetical protein n=1 Tax=Pseudomonas farsensis TaxID=2745492 RepID=UPI003C7C1035
MVYLAPTLSFGAPLRAGLFRPHRRLSPAPTEIAHSRNIKVWPIFLWEITQPFRAALSRREQGTVGAGLPRDAMLAVLSLS